MTELISRQAALAEIDKNREALLSSGMTGAEHILVHYGRRVIEGLPTIDVPDKNVGDLISRQAAIDAVADLYWMDERLLNFKKEIDATFDKIKALPPAQPEPKFGKWEHHIGIGNVALLKCSECGFTYPELLGMMLFKFCPNCGRQMERDDEHTD